MSTLALDGVMPRSRRNDPVTSVDAGRSVDLNDSQRAVLEMFTDLRLSLSDRELVNHMIQEGSPYTPPRLRSARAELTAVGLVERVEGEFRRSPFGRREQVWEIA